MAFLIEGDLNKAHDQAMAFWATLGATKKRDLRVLADNTTGMPVCYYGTDSYSTKCAMLEGAGALPNDELPAGQTMVLGWSGSIRITAAHAFYVDTSPKDIAKYNADVRSFAREVVVFYVYGLVSRAKGGNTVYVKAERHNGTIRNGSLRGFDYSRPDGGYEAGELAMAHMAAGEPYMSNADYRLSDRARHYYVSQFCENCYDIDDERIDMTAVADSLGGELKVHANITGVNDCELKVHISRS